MGTQGAQQKVPEPEAGVSDLAGTQVEGCDVLLMLGVLCPDHGLQRCGIHDVQIG
jgi:hypothetical protein